MRNGERFVDRQGEHDSKAMKKKDVLKGVADERLVDSKFRQGSEPGRLAPGVPELLFHFLVSDFRSEQRPPLTNLPVLGGSTR